MTVTEIVAEINYAHKGNTKVIAEGTPKWDRTLSIMNRKIREWAQARDVAWASLFEERTLSATFTNSTQTYNLPTDTHKLSDYVYVLDDNGERKPYSVIKPAQRGDYTESNAVYVSSTDPKKITFTATISSSDPNVGNSIIAGIYKMPAALTAGSDEVKIDNEEWLIYATAAELARNDPAKDDQFGNLQGIANDKWLDMIAANNSLPYGQVNAAGLNLQIPGESW